jgi:multiple sugar transport system permease protein
MSLRGSAAARDSYLIAAICFALMALMLFPLVMSLLTSVKPAGEAAMWPPNYLPSRLSFSNYVEMYNYQAGLPIYLFNSFSVAFMTISGCVILASLAGFGLARFSIPYKELFFLLLICGMMIPYQTLLTPLYMMFSSLRFQNTRVGLAIVHTSGCLRFQSRSGRKLFDALPVRQRMRLITPINVFSSKIALTKDARGQSPHSSPYPIRWRARSNQ